jgi:hypothetical protein
MQHRLVVVASLFLAVRGAHEADAQPAPLAPIRDRGQSVSPVFEGWYRNADGTYSLSFGYFNRNGAEVVDVPLGAANFITPAAFDGAQPTQFHPRRHWGVFAVRVPADFGRQRVVWTLVTRGDSTAIPASLADGWQIDALDGEAGSGNTPPRLRFSADGPEGAGPGGIIAGPIAAPAGVPVTLDVWARDDGNVRNSVATGGRRGVPVALTWFKHQGPGSVTFDGASPRVDDAGRATTTATFSEPGAYVLRVRANDASGVASAGHSQCCWSNGFLKVTVTRQAGGR